MKKGTCISCGNSKAQLECGICHGAICKSCTQFLETDHLFYMPQIPEHLSHQTYCEPCFNEVIAKDLDIYNDNIAKAKEVAVFEKNQGKETRMIKRDHDPVYIKDCVDYNQAILKLAFQAVLVGCNAIIDMDLNQKKVKSGGTYRTSAWSGSAIPAHVSPDQLVKDRSIWHNPN